MELLMGVDVGSSDCKVMITTLSGSVVASRAEPYPTHHPRLNWAEQDPDDWYRVACRAIRSCLAESSIDPRAILGLSIDGPAHNVALLDEQGQVLRSTIHWSDLRSKPQAARLDVECGERIFAITGTRSNPSWTLAQLLWVKENQPEIWSKLRRFLVTKDYVRYRFDGAYRTDVYDAIGTQMFDLRANHWSGELCAVLGFDPEWLPDVAAATSVSGWVQPSAARDSGLLSGTPVAVGSGDSVVEAFGIGAVEPGDCIIKVGTAANVNLVTAAACPSSQTITYRHVVEPRWFSITPTNAGASTMRWFRDTFCRHEAEQAAGQGISVHELIDQLASDIPAGCEGLLFHPYLNGERAPYWDPDLRGSFIGLRAHHTLRHFARAVLEGVAFSIRDCLDVVEALGQPITSYRIIGGGTKSRLWRQIMADVLGQPLRKPAVEDAAFGAALLAGVAAGVFPDLTAALSACAPEEQVIQPNPKASAHYTSFFELYRAISNDLRTYGHRLAGIANSQQDLQEAPRGD